MKLVPELTPQKGDEVVQIALHDNIFNPKISLFFTIDQFYEEEDWTQHLQVELKSGEMVTELSVYEWSPEKLEIFADELKKLAKLYRKTINNRGFHLTKGEN